MFRKLVLHSLNFENLAMKGCSSSIAPEEHLLYILSDLSRFLYLPVSILTLKVPITTAADNSLEYFFHCFSDKILLDISCESSAWQRIHKKDQALFSLKDKSKNNKSVVCCNFAWLFKG